MVLFQKISNLPAALDFKAKYTVEAEILNHKYVLSLNF
jgi:hypothetical protein